MVAHPAIPAAKAMMSADRIARGEAPRRARVGANDGSGLEGMPPYARIESVLKSAGWSDTLAKAGGCGIQAGPQGCAAGSREPPDGPTTLRLARSRRDPRGDRPA